MIKIAKLVAIFIVAMFSCSISTIPPKMTPASSGGITIEGMRLYNGRLFILKSMVFPGGKYWRTANVIPAIKRCWVEIYTSVNGRIVLYKIMEARKIPAQPESWELKEFKKEIN